MDGGISEDSKKLIEQSITKFNNFSIEYIDMSNFGLERFPNLRYYSLNTFSRYFIPKVKPDFKKILYLDVDIILKSDIAELYNQDLDGYPIGVVLEDFIGLNGLYIQEHIDSNFKSGPKSFNAGVMLLDIPQFIKNNYTDILISKTIELADKLSCPDQDIFNIVFENNYKILDYKWNFMIDLYKLFKKMYPQKAEETMKNYAIVHYVIYKPWKCKLSLGQNDFEEIANKTLFADYIKKTLQENMKANKLKRSFLEMIFSIKKDPNEPFKIITILGIKIKIKLKRKI